MWRYTPRQISAFLFIAIRRRQQQAADDLTLAALAARGESKKIKETVRRLKNG